MARTTLSRVPREARPLRGQLRTRPAHLPAAQELAILFHEYHALYGLLTPRIQSLERRSPFAGAILIAFLGSIAVLPEPAQIFVLVGIPFALVLFLQTTITHARSFEDLVRRIDEIEQRVNRLAGDDLLVFQSSHPSKGRAIGGRTGTATVLAVFLSSLLMLGASLVLSWSIPALAVPHYTLYLSGASAYLPISVMRFWRYRYRHSN